MVAGMISSKGEGLIQYTHNVARCIANQKLNGY